MRVAVFHDDDPRLPRLRADLEARGHRVLAVGPGMSHAFLAKLLNDDRPDVIHSLGRGFFGAVSAAYWRARLRGQGTRRVHDVRGVPFTDGLVDGSLPGAQLEDAYLRVLGLR